MPKNPYQIPPCCMMTKLELLIIILASSALLWLGIGDIWGHRIHHPYPYTYLATDTFQHQTRAQWIKDQGNYQYEAPYYSAGFTDVIGFYPPLLNHLAVILSYLSGQEVYDVIILLPIIFAIIAVLIMYITIRSINPSLAMLALPFTTFMFFIKETLVAFFWGHWPALIGDFYLYASGIMITRLHEKNKWIILSFLLIGTILAHTAAFVFAGFFLAIWIAYTNYFATDKKPARKHIILTTIIVILATGFFLNLFRQSWMLIHPFKFEIITDWTGGGGFLQFSHFGIIKYLLLAGIPLAIMLAKQHTTLLLSLYFLIAGFGNYAGLTIRAFNLRFYWPIMLTPLFALPIYWLVKKTGKYKLLITILLTFILFSTITYAFYKRSVDQEGYMNTHIWDNLVWLRDNTPANATVYFAFGDYYDQDAGLGNAKRVFSRTETEDFVEYFKNGTLQRYLPIKLFVEAGAGLPYKTRPFAYNLHLLEQKDHLDNHKIRDLCSYDYYVFDRVTQYPEIVTYSLKYAQKMIESGHFEPAHQNTWGFILHNKKPGEACL